MPTFIYPERSDHESDSTYWQRVADMGLPMPWEQDAAAPPGAVAVAYEWSLQPANSVHVLADIYYCTNTEDAAALHKLHPDHILVRRTRWVAVGEWTPADAQD